MQKETSYTRRSLVETRPNKFCVTIAQWSYLRFTLESRGPHKNIFCLDLGKQLLLAIALTLVMHYMPPTG